MRSTVLEMVPIVEEIIGADMGKNGRGTMLQDGWSNHGAHHVGVLTSFIRKIKTIVEGKVVYKEKNVIALLACSTLGAVDEEAEHCALKFHMFHSLCDVMT